MQNNSETDVYKELLATMLPRARQGASVKELEVYSTDLVAKFTALGVGRDLYFVSRRAAVQATQIAAAEQRYAKVFKDCWTAYWLEKSVGKRRAILGQLQDFRNAAVAEGISTPDVYALDNAAESLAVAEIKADADKYAAEAQVKSGRKGPLSGYMPDEKTDTGTPSTQSLQSMLAAIWQQFAGGDIDLKEAERLTVSTAQVATASRHVAFADAVRLIYSIWPQHYLYPLPVQSLDDMFIPLVVTTGQERVQSNSHTDAAEQSFREECLQTWAQFFANGGSHSAKKPKVFRRNVKLAHGLDSAKAWQIVNATKGEVIAKRSSAAVAWQPSDKAADKAADKAPADDLRRTGVAAHCKASIQHYLDKLTESVGAGEATKFIQSLVGTQFDEKAYTEKLEYAYSEHVYKKTAATRQRLKELKDLAIREGCSKTRVRTIHYAVGSLIHEAATELRAAVRSGKVTPNRLTNAAQRGLKIEAIDAIMAEGAKKPRRLTAMQALAQCLQKLNTLYTSLKHSNDHRTSVTLREQIDVEWATAVYCGNDWRTLLDAEYPLSAHGVNPLKICLVAGRRVHLLEALQLEAAANGLRRYTGFTGLGSEGVKGEIAEKFITWANDNAREIIQTYGPAR